MELGRDHDPVLQPDHAQQEEAEERLWMAREALDHHKASALVILLKVLPQMQEAVEGVLFQRLMGPEVEPREQLESYCYPSD